MSEPGPNVSHGTELVRPTRLTTAVSSLTVQITLLVTLVALTLWTVFMTGFADVHDPLHWLRHALFMIPCH